MKEERRKNLNIVVIIILFMVILGLVGYICYDKGLFFKSDNKISSKTVENKSNEVKNEETSTHNFHNYVIDSKNCINCTNSNSGIDYSINDGRHIEEVTAKFYSNSNKKAEIYIDIDSYNKKAGTSYKLNSNQFDYGFNQSISDIMIYNIGQEELCPVVVFLKEDGSIEYVDVYEQLGEGSLGSSKVLDNVKDINKLYSVSVCNKDMCNSSTILAQKSDGTFYDLQNEINK